MPLRLSATLTTLGFQGSGQMGNLNVNHPDKHGLILADVMPPGRQSALARLIIVRAIEQDFPGLQSFEQAV
ncbi:MAG: hypothetical protein WBE62_08130 [Methylocella sp.]